MPEQPIKLSDEYINKVISDHNNGIQNCEDIDCFVQLIDTMRDKEWLCQTLAETMKICVKLAEKSDQKVMFSGFDIEALERGELPSRPKGVYRLPVWSFSTDDDVG